MSPQNTFKITLPAGSVPADFWPSYSSFANTDGGIIILCVREKDGKREIEGLAAKYATTLSDVQEKIVSSESKIAEMLGELEGTEDDTAGIDAWMKELAR